jgi:signal transduction histidine kinase
VAREIQASDLSRRIALDGPDDELKRLGDTFDEMLGRLETAFSSQRQFLADTSHDLRTPLTIIRSNVELVADDPSASLEDWERAGEVIQRNAEKMSKMIQDLLASARMQTGKAQSVTVDLAAMARAKAADFASVAAARNVEVIAEAEAATILGVEIALDRALSNLIENAVKAAPEGSTVVVGSGVVNGWAWFAVNDSGQGLPSDPGDRDGLGLSIATQIAEGHGGSLATFAGKGEVGTTMVIWLPGANRQGSPPAQSPFTDP